LKNRLLLFIICILLFISPFLIWGNSYIVGGDDTRLYYVFPLQFLENYAFNIISDNTLAGAMTGYASVSYFAPVFFTIWIFKIIPYLSTQMILYGLNLVVGFLFCFKLIKLWTNDDKNKYFVSNIIASTFYVTSIYLVRTVYTNQLLSLYLVSVLPLTLYLFIKGLRQRNIVFVLLSVLAFSLFSSTINTLPWSAAMLIVLLPFLFYEFWMHRKQFIYYAGIFVGLFFLLNFYWIFHLIYPYFHHGGLPSLFQYYSSSNFINDNIRIITGVAGLYSPINIIFTHMDTQFVTNFSVLTIFQIIFFVCILLAGFLVSKNKNEKKTIYYLSLLSFLLSWFFFSPNIGAYGTKVFLFFSNNIPFFTMFRNMYDKFALPLSFSYAIAFGVSLQIILEYIRNKWIANVLITFIISILIITSIANGIFLQRQINPLSTFSGEFNSDFTQMSLYLQNLNNASRIAWIPLNSPTYVSIEDGKYPGHFYSGLSPLRELANMSDYTGRFSFITQTDLFLGDKLFNLINEAKYSQAGELLQQRNTKFIIVDHQLPPTYLQSFYFGGDNLPILKNQGSKFQKIILGSKIKDFGSRYSLYNINPQFENDKLFLADNFKNFPKTYNNLSYKRLNSYSYDISISHLKNSEKLIFLDPYYKDWTLHLMTPNGSTEEYENGENALVFGYANGWTIDPEKIISNYNSNYYTRNTDGSINLSFRLYFDIQKYTYIAYIISGAVFAIICGYVLYYFIIKFRL